MTGVLHVVEVDHGGVVSYVRDVIREQLRRDYDVHVLAPEGVLDLPGVRKVDWSLERRRPASLPKAAGLLRRTVTSVRPDVVHLHSFFPGLIGRSISLPDTRVVFQPHSWAFNASSRRVLNKVVARWERLASRRTHAIACTSLGEIQEARDEGLSDLRAPVGSPVDVEYFHPVEEDVRQECRATLGIRKPRMIVCVGRVCRQKGQDLLLEGWARSPVPDTELVLVGPGDAQPLLDKHPGIEESVRAVGGVDDVRPWLWASDFSVLTSRYEANGSLVVGEAMACGRAAMSTEVAGAKDVIGTAEAAAGCVVPQGDIDGLLAECRRRFDEPALLARETANARRRAVDRFSISAVVDNLESLYTDPADQTGPTDPAGPTGPAADGGIDSLRTEQGSANQGGRQHT